MKRFLSLMVACICLLGWAVPACAADGGEDYTVAGKLLKQLWAGSGFSGTLTLEIASKPGGLCTLKPIEAALDYIYVRPTATEGAEHRADLTLMDGDDALSAAHAQLKDGALAVQADLLSPDWYAFAMPEDAGEETVSALFDGLKSQLLRQTGMPALAPLAARVLAALNTAELDDMLATYTTRMDLWIEGYRESAVLDKLADGTTTMEARYTVSPNAIKAQAKQMVFDLLSDTAALPALQEALGDELSDLLLNPDLRSYYFAAIDALPLSGNLVISRTVALTGDTLALHLSLPLYDAQGGNVTLKYDRERGDGDLPDDNTISIESDVSALKLVYQEYSSMTDVRVIQGSLVSEPRGADVFDVDADAAPKALAVDFTLRQQESESKDEEGRDVYGYDAKLTLSPAGAGEGYVALPETEITLASTFASKELKSAATDMQATLTLGGEGWDETVTLTLTGRSRQKWTPEALPDERISVPQMSQEDVSALLPGAATRALALFAPYLGVTEAEPEGEAEGALEGTPESAPEGTQAPEDAQPSDAPEDEAQPAPEDEAQPASQDEGNSAPEDETQPAPEDEAQPASGIQG